MLTILAREPAAPLPSNDVPVEQTLTIEEDSQEFEIVVGRRQLAGILFVATVILAVFSAVFYLAGKAAGPAPKIVERIVTVPAPSPAATPAPPAHSADNHSLQPGGPLFADPQTGALYLQMGAVEKGIAVIFVEGLRSHGMPAFAAPGPNEKIFRVLIGPFPDSDAFQRAKQTVDGIGLSTFARKYQD